MNSQNEQTQTPTVRFTAPHDYLELLGKKPHHAPEVKLPTGARPVPCNVRRIPAEDMLD